jgi:hypothetical protein
MVPTQMLYEESAEGHELEEPPPLTHRKRLRMGCTSSLVDSPTLRLRMSRSKFCASLLVLRFRRRKKEMMTNTRTIYICLSTIQFIGS